MKMNTLFLSILSVFGMSLTAQNQLVIPDTLSGVSFELNLQNGTMQFYEGQTTNTMGVNGNILGPTLIMQKNDFVDIIVNNNLDETTTIHWHGMHVSAINDGGPHTAIEPNETWNPSFTVMDKAATYWYHPHLHEKTNEHVSKGIAGFIIVRDEEEAVLDLPRNYGIDDFPLVIQTKDFDANNQLVTHSNSDDVLLVNATINPVLEVPAQVVRIRLLNGSSQRVFNLGLSDNQTFYQIASDDGLLSETNAVTRLRMSPGERVEILLDLNGMDGQTLNLMSYASEFPNGFYGATNPGMMAMMTLDGYNPNSMNGNNFNLLELDVVAATDDAVVNIPSTLVDVNPWDESSATQTRTLTFTPEVMGPNQLNGNFLINGTSFNMDVINYSIPINNVEIWTITNQSGIAHPFHIHDVHFYVLDRNGSMPPVSEQGRKDVILVPAQETVRIITKFTDFANDDVPYMYHCHMLTHEDDGMMGQFEVIDESVGFEEYESHTDDIILYPNPLINGNSLLRIISQKSLISSYELYNLTGTKISQGQIINGENQFQIDLSRIDKGTYLLKLISKENTATRMIFIQ